MPPKKVEQPPLLLGRPGNNLKAGIVGLANVGKSSKSIAGAQLSH